VDAKERDSEVMEDMVDTEEMDLDTDLVEKLIHLDK